MCVCVCTHFLFGLGLKQARPWLARSLAPFWHPGLVGALEEEEEEHL